MVRPLGCLEKIERHAELCRYFAKEVNWAFFIEAVISLHSENSPTWTVWILSERVGVLYSLRTRQKSVSNKLN